MLLISANQGDFKLSVTCFGVVHQILNTTSICTARILPVHVSVNCKHVYHFTICTLYTQSDTLFKDCSQYYTAIVRFVVAELYL